MTETQKPPQNYIQHSIGIIYEGKRIKARRVLLVHGSGAPRNGAIPIPRGGRLVRVRLGRGAVGQSDGRPGGTTPPRSVESPTKNKERLLDDGNTEYVFGCAAHDERGDVASDAVSCGVALVQPHGGLPAGGGAGPIWRHDIHRMADLSMRPGAIQTNRGLLREILIAFLFKAGI